MDAFIQLLKDNLDGLAETELTPATLLKDTALKDSLSLLILMTLIEEDYGVSLSGDNIRQCVTLSDLFARIEHARANT